MKFRAISILSILIVFTLAFGICGCSENVVNVSSTSSKSQNQVAAPDSSAPSTVTGSESEVELALNPLTGIYDLEPSSINNRPVAIMINNVKVAQSVQTGLDQADIVYEAYAEGGVTRLLAVYKDIKKADTIGTIRSARYSYVDLAMGHDAIYVHAGINSTHATPHVKEMGIDNINLLYGKYNGMSFREKNGKALEHTLYTTGQKLWNGFDKLKWRTELKYNTDKWQNFVSADNSVIPSGGTCNTISVTMSYNYVSNFIYDTSTGKYFKNSGTAQHKDYKTGKQLEFKNILVLKTSVTALSSDGYIVKTGLSGGEGYYVSNGGYQKIKWSKGDAKNPITITLEDGSACPYNAGNTWVCLVNKKNKVTLS